MAQFILNLGPEIAAQVTRKPYSLIRRFRKLGAEVSHFIASKAKAKPILDLETGVGVKDYKKKTMKLFMQSGTYKAPFKRMEIFKLLKVSEKWKKLLDDDNASNVAPKKPAENSGGYSKSDRDKQRKINNQ